MNKRILLIIGFIILIVAFGVMIYFVFIKDLISPDNANANQNANGATNGSLPITNGISNVNRITNVANINTLTNIGQPVNVNGATVDTIARGSTTLAKSAADDQVLAAEPAVGSQGIRYYDKDKGKFFQRIEQGEATEMSDQYFPDAREISWSPTKNQAVITFPDQSKILYDFDAKQQVTLPKEWDDINFSPTGERIGFKNMSNTTSERWLAVAKPDGSEAALIEPLGDKADQVAVNWSPTGQVVALFSKSSGGTTQEVFFLGLNGENYKSLQTDGRGFEGQWSSSGSQLIYSVYSQSTRYNPRLYLVDASGDQIGANKIDLGLSTWSSKCAFDKNNSYAYCAVPQSLPEGSGLDPQAAGRTNDSIYRIDLSNGSKSIIALPTFTTGSHDYAIDSLFVASNSQYLYFSDSVAGKVYNIQLK